MYSSQGKKASETGFMVNKLCVRSTVQDTEEHKWVTEAKFMNQKETICPNAPTYHIHDTQVWEGCVHL